MAKIKNFKARIVAVFILITGVTLVFNASAADSPVADTNANSSNHAAPSKEEHKADLSASSNSQSNETTTSDSESSNHRVLAGEWLKKAEKELTARDYAKAGRAFQRAAEYKENDASLYFRAAQAYSYAEKRDAALEMLERAHKIDPENLDYMKAQARLTAGDEKNEALLIGSYEKILKKEPDYMPALMRLGEYHTTKKNFTEAQKYYGRVLVKNPDNKEVLIDSIQAQIWATDYARAKASLDSYKAKFGADNNYMTEQARLLSFTHPKEAVALVDTQFQVDPTNVELPKIKTYALDYQKAIATGKVVEEKPVPPLLASARSLYAQKKYNEALSVYQKYLKENPKDKDAFQEMIQINVFNEQYAKAKNLLDQYLKTFGEDVGYLTEKARYFSLHNQSKEALAITRALLKKYPNNKEVQSIQAYALKHPTTHDSGDEDGPKTPEEIMLECINKLVEKDKLTAAASAYFCFTAKYPSNKTAWLEYASVESWRGNYRGALKILTCYYKLFGPTKEYLKTQARILADAGRANCALSIIRPMLLTEPDEFELNYTLGLVQYYNNQPGYMFDTLHKLWCMYPEKEKRKETKSLKNYIGTPFRSNVVVDTFRSRDTDTVDIARGIISVNIFKTPCRKYFVNLREERVSADRSSGLEPIDGGNGTNITSVMGGISERINPLLGLEGSVGAAHLSDNHNSPIYKFVANIKPNDPLVIDWTEAFDYYDVAARTLSLNIRQQLHQIDFAWEPCIHRYLIGQIYYANYTDSNSQWFVNLAPKMSIIRTEYFNFDVGVRGTWYGFSEQPENGYYTPRFYQDYQVTTNAYFAQSENVGYNLYLAIGQQKDETFDSFKFAGDIGISGFFGFYRNWMLVLSAEGSNRGRNIADTTQSNKPYQVYNIQATITRRF